MMHVRQLMSEKVFACRPGDGLHVAAGLMWDHDCGSVAVVDDASRLVGIVTDRDLCMAALLRGLPLHEITVESMMQRDVQTCRPNDSITVIEVLMAEHQIRRIPVVDDGERPIGMISIFDLARLAARTGPGMPERVSTLVRTFVSICTPRTERNALPASTGKRGSPQTSDGAWRDA